jgi:hypothetical protein
VGGSVREHLKPRGFEVAGSGSAQAREAITRTGGIDPANGVLALVRLGAPVTTASSQETIAAVETKLRSDPAVVTVLDWRARQTTPQWSPGTAARPI